ncbi:hypothetical protein O988_06868 [Pseudogymnoascus sp. VKM F-3808]|nr:hypothetical protein O988_06868 [Pseudogymnoascus sp. VKM F-3808]
MAVRVENRDDEREGEGIDEIDENGKYTSNCAHASLEVASYNKLFLVSVLLLNNYVVLPPNAPKAVAESRGEPVRERETFKYYPTLTTGATSNHSGQSVSSSELSSCDDAVLTALAQAGAFQTGTDRSLISLFDADNQYIVAEATQSSRLLPSVRSGDCRQPLWLCGTFIPRSHGVCELSLLGENTTQTDEAGSEACAELPLTLADDLVIDPRFCSKPFCQPGTLCRFYAAVPIRTRRGINIGLYCVINETPSKVWTEEYTQTLRDISHTIMDHLESKRLGDLHRRNERMNRGLGSFIEGKSTLSGWQSGPHAAAFVDKPAFEGDLNPKQQSLLLEQNDLASNTAESGMLSIAASDNPTVPPRQNVEAKSFGGSFRHIERPLENRDGISDCESPAGIFSKAANIIRESTEVEGCLFVDATMEAYRSPSQTNTTVNTMGLFATASSSDDSSDYAPSGQSCRVLAYSTSDKSSIDGDAPKQHIIALPDKFLTKLLRRYPKGKVFNFGTDGVLQPSDSSEDDGNLSPSKFAEKLSLLSDRGNISNLSTHDKPSKKPWARHREGNILLKAFPGVQSVAFTPVWDPRKDRWHADLAQKPSPGFKALRLPRFGTRGKIDGMPVVSSILTLQPETLPSRVDKAKSDILGSLSHELRPPLHGIILSAELLSDTRLSVFQGNAAHTIEVCSRTLLDTIDHLLDYSKINSFARRGSKLKVSSGPRSVAVVDDSGQFGEKDLACNTRLDRLIEEVTESVFAGYTFQYLSVMQPSARQVESIDRNAIVSNQQHPMQTMLQFDPIPAAGVRLSQEFGEVSVILSIDARQTWTYFAQVGAIRRIVMNIFGNALKYTTRGTIKVSLTQERRSIYHGQKEQVVKFTVQDTGKGIGPDFLKHDLFRPFSQEDTLTPGTGLGLSLVKQIVSQLRGEVLVQSQVGIGTTASVILPLERVSQSPEKPLRGSEDDQMFEEQVQDLKGLRIGLSLSHHNRGGNISDWQKSVPDICREWLMMEIVSNIPGTTTADILLWSHDELPSLSKDIEALAKTPNVVVCPNALVAYRQSKNFEAADYTAVFEFISQPIGPRKLARAVFLAYTRWMNVSDSPTSRSTAVLDARNNLANQEVFRMARAADPAGVRTVGIITKCDALQEGDEEGALKIAQNSVERLHHGWFAVKNRSTKEIQDGVTMEQRHINERKFFETVPFNQLSKDRVGIPSLKKFLGKLLYTHIRGEFPGLVQEIRKLVHGCRDELDALGPSRQTFMEQRQFVTRLVATYQRTAIDSLSGHYDSDLEPEHYLKLRMHIQNANEAFGRSIESFGHTRPFNMVDGTVDKSFGCVPFDKHLKIKNIDNWILKQYRQSRGAELPGTVNPVVLESLFRQQSARWGPLAEQHVVNVEEIVCNFNQALLESLVSEDVLRANIEARNLTFYNAAHDAAIVQLRQIIADERSGILQTINHYFADTLAKTREERVLNRLKEVGLEDGQYQTIDLAAITRAAHLSNEDQAVNDIHDILKAYYKVALKRYMDNVVLQVIERIYLGSNGPVRAISPEYVGTLSDTELADIAAESYATSSTRTEIGYKLQRLDKALNLAETVPI